MEDYEWQVNDLHLYKTYTVEDTQDASFGISLLIPLDATNRNNGSFRLVLFGGGTETIQLQATDIFSGLPFSLRSPSSTSHLPDPLPGEQHSLRLDGRHGNDQECQLKIFTAKTKKFFSIPIPQFHNLTCTQSKLLLITVPVLVPHKICL
jgi:hypothetical protein